MTLIASRSRHARPLTLSLALLASCASQPPNLDPFGRPHEPANQLAAAEMRKCEPRDVDSAPRLISGTRPLYPIEEMLHDRSGVAVVRFEVTVAGRARVVEQKAENKWLAVHVGIAMRDWRFEPGRRGGRAVSMVCELRFHFQTHREAEARGS